MRCYLDFLSECLSISFHPINVTGCFTPYCCHCAFCSIPLFPAAYLQDFSVNFRFIPSMSLAALPPIVVFALSAQFLSFKQHISKTSPTIFVSFHQCNWLLCLCCCLCALRQIPLFPAAYLQDLSDNFRFILSMSLAALPLLLPLRSLPHSSLSSSISPRLLLQFSFH